MVGAPGAGKGTQAALLSERLGIPHVASGDLFRSHIRDETPLGKKARPFIDRGALVPDAVTVRMIAERLSQPDAAEGVIIDGFPRTRPQAEAFDAMLQRKGGHVAGALYVDVDREELLLRLSGRRICQLSDDHVYHETERPPLVPGRCDVDGAELYQRDDDRPETVQARLDEQLPPMFDVVDHYAEAGVLTTIDGGRSIAEVTEDLLHAIEAPVR